MLAPVPIEVRAVEQAALAAAIHAAASFEFKVKRADCHLG
jgi:hypothetical protein